MLSSQPSPVNDDQTLSRSRSSTLVSPSAHSYSFHEIKSLEWIHRLGTGSGVGSSEKTQRRRRGETLRRGNGGRQTTGEEPRIEGLTLVESLAAKVAGSPRVRDQDAHKTSCEAQPRSKKQRLNDELCR